MSVSFALLYMLLLSSTCSARQLWTMELMTVTFPMSPRYKAFTSLSEGTISFNQSINRSITRPINASTYPTLWMFGGGITHSDEQAVIENDVWSSLDLGQSWSLKSGISRFGQSGRVDSACSTCSFRAQQWSTAYHSTLSHTSVIIGGHSERGASNELWISTDNIHWSIASRAAPFKPVYGAMTSGNGNNIFHMLGGKFIDQDMSTDVWQGVVSDDQLSWTYYGSAPYPPRWWPLVITGSTAAGEMMYVLGGQSADGTSAMNDVWVMQTSTKRWAPLVLDGDVAPPGIADVSSFTPRSSHSGYINRDGVILLFGGSELTSPYRSYMDLWASFDGGYHFTRCVSDMMPIGSHRLMFYTSQTSTVTDDGELILMGGLYECADPACQLPHPNSLQVRKTPFSVHNTSLLAEICDVILPAEGVGLRQWPTPPNPSSTGDNGSTGQQQDVQTSMSGVQIALIVMGVVLCLLVVVGVIVWWRHCYWPCRIHLMYKMQQQQRIAEISLSEAEYAHM